MFKKVTSAMVTLLAIMAVPAFADECKTDSIVGSYMRTEVLPPFDILGAGAPIVRRAYLNQLRLHGDGTADQFATSSLDLMMNRGTRSPAIGSWKCREDGKNVVTLVSSIYRTTPLNYPGIRLDIGLADNLRITSLFSVVDHNTLNAVQTRTRVYNMAEDPSDATSGTLGALTNETLVYRRLAGSDADLLAP